MADTKCPICARNLLDEIGNCTGCSNSPALCTCKGGYDFKERIERGDFDTTGDHEEAR